MPFMGTILHSFEAYANIYSILKVEKSEVERDILNCYQSVPYMTKLAFGSIMWL